MQSSTQAEYSNAGSGYGGTLLKSWTGSSSIGDKSPLSNLPFLKNLTQDKKATKEGQPPKRRGPKPDSKPALTRRQELNRQAQRTHRERKEQYIKALEHEVLQLKEIYAESTRERDRVQKENIRLKALLAQHGISYDFGETEVKFQRQNSGYGASSSGSISGSYRGASDSTGFSPPPPPGTNGSSGGMSQQTQRGNMAQLPNNRLDYDQIGIDFVLTYDSQGRPIQVPAPYPSPPPQLERPCMDHMQYLVVRSHNSDEQTFHHPGENADDREYEHMSGHALMATCPPYAHIRDHPNEPYPIKMPELDAPDLTKLLNLSARLPLNQDSEITPIMAWTKIYRDPRISLLTAADIQKIKVDLCAKARCYGFGAVLEEFEVNDALEMVFADKGFSPTNGHSF